MDSSNPDHGNSDAQNAEAPQRALGLGDVTASDKRQNWIDCVKGVTISMVVLHHNYSGFRSIDAISLTAVHFYALLSPIRMPLFFLIAGFFAKKAIFGPWDAFLRKKILHFAYFYVLWSIISILSRKAFGSVTTHEVQVSQIYKIFWEPSFTLWFLYGLLIAFAVARLTRRIPFPIQAGLAIVIATIVKIQVGGTDNVLWKVVQLYPFFLIGVYLSQNIRQWVANATFRRVGVLVVLYGAVTVYAYLFRSIEKPYVYYPSAILAAAVVMSVMFLLRNSLFGKTFGYLGRHSLYIYLLHFLPAAGARVLGKHVGLAQHVWLNIALGTVLSIIFCLLVYYVAIRVPVLRYIYRDPNFEWLIPVRAPNGRASS